MSVKFPEISLYVDGQLFKAEKKNPEIIDDWPLHPTKGINTTVTVGACWQGGYIEIVVTSDFYWLFIILL